MHVDEMLSYVRNPPGGVPSSLGGIVGSCARDKNLCDADDLTVALMSQLRLAVSDVRRLPCQQQQQQQRSFSFCCVPTGCKRYLENPIWSDDHADAVRVVCSNSKCSVSRLMHADCFRDWERLVMFCVRSFMALGRDAEWNKGQERPQDLELALKACVCICSKGYVGKDLAYYEPKDCVGNILNSRAKHHHHQQPQLQQVGWKAQDRTQGCCRKTPSSYDADQAFQVRVRTFSFSSTGSSLTNSTATPPPDERSPSILSPSTTPTAELTSQLATTSASGNIFRHRCDLSAFRVLPTTVRNSYHIKVDDDGPHGNDKIRSFLLTNLTRKGIRQVPCVVCSSVLSIYDEFPLIDGTFFLSPRCYADGNMCVVFDRRMVYLNAVCLGCLDGSGTRLLCRGCLAPWEGSSFILGTMYSYDIFAAMSCCRCRLSCSGCRLVVEEPRNLRFFSDYSRLTRCPHCELEDYHFLKPLKDIFIFKTF